MGDGIRVIERDDTALLHNPIIGSWTLIDPFGGNLSQVNREHCLHPTEVLTK